MPLTPPVYIAVQIAREKRERDRRHSELLRDWRYTVTPWPEPIGAGVIGELDDEHPDPDTDPDDCGCPVDHDAELDIDPDDQCGPFRLAYLDRH